MLEYAGFLICERFFDGKVVFFWSNTVGVRRKTKVRLVRHTAALLLAAYWDWCDNNNKNSFVYL